MAKIVDPLQFSTAYEIAPERLAEVGVLDPTLNVDTKLFVDPLLLRSSHHPEIRRARITYAERFTRVIDLLRGSRARGDAPWRAAELLLSFPEVVWTCLGYGAATVRGSGSGPLLRAEVMTTAKEIVDLGVTNPDLFVAMALFENGTGPDRISDMTTRVILTDLFAFNRRIIHELALHPTTYTWDGQTQELAANPKLDKQPVLLVPLDILRPLPIALDWDGVISASSHNAALRSRVNLDIGNIWARRTRREKAEMRALVLRSKRAFETYLELLESVRKEPYDSSGDPEGELFWRRQLSEIAQTEPLRLELSGAPDNEKVVAIVETIIEQFRHLIEDRRYSAELYRDDGSPRPEKAAQRFFFAVADCYCKANNLDVTPEADTGAGTVDFKFSTGYKCRITVEIKLSTNSKLVSGFENQITAYSIAEDAAASFYVVIDVGRLGRKDQELQKLRNEWKMQTKLRPELKFVDGKLRPSASRR